MCLVDIYIFFLEQEEYSLGVFHYSLNGYNVAIVS